jgi:hypothetical protein
LIGQGGEHEAILHDSATLEAHRLKQILHG